MSSASLDGSCYSDDIEYKKKELKVVGKYVLGLRLGKGSYGKVKEAIHIDTKKIYAIKICKEQALRKIPGAMRQVEAEIEILKQMQHPSIIRMHSHWRDNDKIYIVQDYVGGGTLQSFLKARNKPLPCSQARKIFIGIIQGIEYLHESGILHGDIKPENILLTAKGNVKLIDFGVSIRLDKEEDPKQIEDENRSFGDVQCGRGHGTVAYQPPEIVSGMEKLFSSCGPRLDIWASSIILYTLSVGKYPFDGPSIGAVLENIAQLNFELPDELPADLKDLLTLLLCKYDPNHNYLTIEDIKNHPWCKGNLADLEVSISPSIFERRKRGGYRVIGEESGCNVL